MKRVVFIVIFIFGLVGCVTYYEHPTKKSAAEFNRDKHECQRIAEQVYLKNHTRVCDEVDRCLLARGWRR